MPVSNLQTYRAKLIINLLDKTGDRMQVNVAQLLKEVVGSTRSYEVDEVIDLDVAGDRSGGLVRGNVKLTRINRSIIVTGRISTAVKVSCSRCLSQCDCPLEMDIQEEFFPLTDIVTGTPVLLPEESDAFTINEQHVLDLTEAVRQTILLALPMKPLCREDCAGLCPRCGKNLNEGLCGCSSDEIAPRWAKLTSIKVRLKEQEGK
jgi:uncharacterized protein